MLPSAAEQALGQGIAALPFAITDEQIEQFRAYLQLLNRWNTVHNLTSVRDPREQVIVHLLDCLAVLPHLPDVKTLADIGSGAGLPALIIAIMRPEMIVYAVESNNKKSAFIRQVATALHLSNVKVVSERVESWLPEQAINCVISRAMAAPQMLLDLTAHLGDAQTQWLMMCGHMPQDAETKRFVVKKKISVKVPMLDATRSLLVMVKEDDDD
ncbi:16S rRNA (guanine(527)-N(7))-methyltransferase RsmG [Cardiobacteriaceae bacterium TAE3-ERU3]|nr:16S rRNA (guanine(527)-N(7))-methyltransferase RsmG [Cardiobacteriaceae bacterium TAE3-ERU3]